MFTQFLYDRSLPAFLVSMANSSSCVTPLVFLLSASRELELGAVLLRDL